MSAPHDLSASIALLENTPESIVRLVAPLPDFLLHQNEGPGTWSPYEVLQHLIWGEVDDWIPRARLILEHQDRVAFTPFDRDGGKKHYEGWAVRDLIDEFKRLRTENLATLRGFKLTDAQLSLPGKHPALGPVTLSQLLASWVSHDLTHLFQITRTLAGDYREAVGPWTAFMGIYHVERRQQ
jgi:DinB family protein